MNLQLDHFPMIKTTKPNPASARTCCAFELNFQLHFCRLSLQCVTTKHAQCLEHGFHNVSRWMTWLPISLKNAAKCDKWYQLQNLSITESLNANGTRKKLHWGQLRVCHSQCRTKTKKRKIFKKALAFFSFKKQILISLVRF